MKGRRRRARLKLSPAPPLRPSQVCGRPSTKECYVCTLRFCDFCTRKQHWKACASSVPQSTFHPEPWRQTTKVHYESPPPRMASPLLHTTSVLRPATAPQGRFRLHWPVHNVPGHMATTLAKRQLEQKRLGATEVPSIGSCRDTRRGGWRQLVATASRREKAYFLHSKRASGMSYERHNFVTGF